MDKKEAVGILFATINAPFGTMKYFLAKQSGEFQIVFNDSNSENAKKEGLLVTKAAAEKHFPNFDWVDFSDLTEKVECKMNKQEVVGEIDGPEKVIVPEFVAKWYEKNIEGLYETIIDLIRDDERLQYRQTNPPAIAQDDKDFIEWFFREDCSFEIIVNMRKFGYEIEKGKLFTVEIPNPNRGIAGFHTVLHRTAKNEIEIFETYLKDYKEIEAFQLTEEEIKRDFAWAWGAGFAEEVENDN